MALYELCIIRTLVLSGQLRADPWLFCLYIYHLVTYSKTCDEDTHTVSLHDRCPLIAVHFIFFFIFPKPGWYLTYIDVVSELSEALWRWPDIPSVVYSLCFFTLVSLTLILYFTTCLMEPGFVPVLSKVRILVTTLYLYLHFSEIINFLSHRMLQTFEAMYT